MGEDESKQAERQGGMYRRKGRKVAVPAGPWPGSEGASGAGQRRGRGWPAGAL